MNRSPFQPLSRNAGEVPSPARRRGPAAPCHAHHPIAHRTRPLGHPATRPLLLTLLALLLPACTTFTEDPDIPALPREFRGVFVQALHHRDWPSAPGLTGAQQRSELEAILDRAVELNLNAIVLQVRPTADALYPAADSTTRTPRTPRTPWSVWLTGDGGLAPNPAWDPLAFAVEQAHQRGLQLHAAFNPTLAVAPSMPGAPSPNHLAQQRPDLIRHIDDATAHLDPAEPDARDATLAAVFDVVERYDIDGVYLDHRFYPTPDPRAEEPFDDQATYDAYRAATEADAGPDAVLPRDDWRRTVTDDWARALYEGVRERSDTCRVTLTTPGVYRAGEPEYVAGPGAYETAFIDPLRWLEQGWLDVLSPVLDGPVADPGRSMLGQYDWWLTQNTDDAGDPLPDARHLWPTLDPDAPGFDANEAAYQVRWTRILARGRTTQGHLLAAAATLMRPNDDAVAALQAQAYTEPALPPATPWLGDGKPPAMPRVRVTARSAAVLRVELDPSSLDPDTHLWVVQAERDGHWSAAIFPASQTTGQITLPPGTGHADPTRVRAFTLDTLGQRSPKAPVE